MVTKAIDRDPPLQDNIDKEHADTLIRPFKTPMGAVVTQTSAISLLNRYCMSLPADQFTISAVTWTKSVKRADEITVKVQLPIQSTLKTEISVSELWEVEVVCIKYNSFHLSITFLYTQVN